MIYVGKPIGVSNLTVFPLTADDPETGATYDAAVKVSRLIEVQVDPQFVKGELPSDDSLEDDITLISSVNVTIHASQLTDTIRAQLMGHTMDSTGGMLVKDNDQPIQLALAFKFLLSDASGDDSKYGYMLLYKGRFQEFSETYQTMDRNGDIKFQTHSGLKGTFVRRDADRHLMYRMREDTPSYSTTKAAAWFTAPQEFTPPSP